MCGLAGILTTRDDRRRSLPESLRRMTATMRHRGPDSEGIWSDADSGIGLGFRRLAILDLSPLGEQPMRSESGRYTLAFNGEVYNHHDLRSALTPAGARFRGRSDTEALLAAFETWGVHQAIPRFAGMFAIAVWDAEERTLTLARDRMGKKPLFVSHSPGLISFASELKALAADPAFDRSVDVDSVAEYLRYIYVPGPATIFGHTRKLPPGHLLRIRDASAPLPASEPYWDVRDAVRAGRAERISDPTAAIEELSDLVDDAVRTRLESDVPLGALLSGGIDSSLVVARAQKFSDRPLRTYTIGFDVPEWDESEHAAAIARHVGTDHTLLRVTGDEALAVIPELPTVFDEPLADPSQIPSILVCQLSRRDVTVALCGDGGDELFGGYNRYVAGPRAIEQALRWPRGLRRVASRAAFALPAEGWDAMAVRLLPDGRRPRVFGEKLQKLGTLLRAETASDGYRTLLSATTDPMRFVPDARSRVALEAEIFETFGDLTLAERMMLVDQLSYLPDDLLAKIDRASMSRSLEVRAPLLDHRVAEFSWRLAPELKIRGTETKWILRELLARDVPRALFERPKMGFSVPLRAWLTGPLRPWAEDLLSTESLREVPVLDPAMTRAAWGELLRGRSGNGLGLWAILQLVSWWRTWRPDLSTALVA